MDGDIARLALSASAACPAPAFGEAPLAARTLDPGMGLAVARRTVFRPAGPGVLRPGRRPGRRRQHRPARPRRPRQHRPGAGAAAQRHRDRRAADLRPAPPARRRRPAGAQHGGVHQLRHRQRLVRQVLPAAERLRRRPQLRRRADGGGLGARRRRCCCICRPDHPDHPAAATWRGFAAELGLPRRPGRGARIPGARTAGRSWPRSPDDAVRLPHRRQPRGLGQGGRIARGDGVPRRTRAAPWCSISPRSARPAAPIRGMQGRPASGPVSLLRAFLNIRRHVIDPARAPILRRWQRRGSRRCCSTIICRWKCRSAAPAARRAWRPSPGATPACCASSAPRRRAGCGPPTTPSWWTPSSGTACAAGDPADPLTAHAARGVPGGDPLRLGQRRARLHQRRPAGGPPHRLGPAPPGGSRTAASFRSARYQVDRGRGAAGGPDARGRPSADFPATTNPCGEITLHVTGGYCVIADFAPLLACPVRVGRCRARRAAAGGRRAVGRAGGGRGAARRALPDARQPMDSLYAEEVARTNRMGIGPTGLHEWAWLRFGLGFADLLDEDARGAVLDHARRTCRRWPRTRATPTPRELGLRRPVTVTTVKPSGTISKLFGLTEGAHLPARRAVSALGAVQGHARPGHRRVDWPAPIRCSPTTPRAATRCATLRSFPGMTDRRLPDRAADHAAWASAERLVTAPEATPDAALPLARLLERHWIGATQGNQVSYTLKVLHRPARSGGVPRHRAARAAGGALLRGAADPAGPCAGLRIPAGGGGFRRGGSPRWSPAIDAQAAAEAVDLAHLQCASGVCPL